MKNGVITGRICFALTAGVHPLTIAAATLNGLSDEMAQLTAILVTGLVAWFAGSRWLDAPFADAVAMGSKYLYGGTGIALLCAIAFSGSDHGILLLTVGALGVGAWMGAEAKGAESGATGIGDIVVAFAAIAAQLLLLWSLATIRIDPLALVQCTTIAILVATLATVRYGWPDVGSTSALPA